jgi:N-sulfoglucosamine sulfohydrolase
MKQQKNRPNIILITAHDLGRHLGCYGVATVQTPCLDRMAAEGVRFTRSFCAAPSCSPSRASLYTGRYPHSNGVMGLTHARFAWDLNPGEKHLVQYLNAAGYRTALIGGQHETRHPEKLGFSDVCDGNWRPCDEVAREVDAWLRKHENDDVPFYLQVGFFEPHRGFGFGGAQPDDSLGITVPPFLMDDDAACREFAAYQGAIKKLDAAVGVILDRVQESALAEETLILFTTDHGIPFPRAKCTLYDPGLGVAHLMKWHGQPWSDGRELDAMISNVDQLPTLLDLLGLPVTAQVQGRSWLPLLEGGRYDERQEIFAEKTYHNYCDPMRCIRTPTHKLIVNFTAAPAFEESSQQYGPKIRPVEPEDPACAYHEPVELYDLVADPYERRNLAGRPEQAERQSHLLGKLCHWMSTTNDPLLTGIPAPPMHRLATHSLMRESVNSQQCK